MTILPESYQNLPATKLLPELMEFLGKSHVVLSSPTGSGKTTCVPLMLRQAQWLGGKKILMLEPRRIAARAAATRMSQMLGQTVGTQVGYRTRFESKISRNTIIEVVTEGILIRQLQNDPELASVGLVIFDEFHERSIHADLGLALCLDLCQLREDLRLLVMSATLATGAVAKLLGDVPIITGEGKCYPVTIEHLPSINKYSSLSDQMTRGVRHAWEQDVGDILAFLPGAGEIKRTMSLLSDQLPEARILPLYGSLSHKEQDRVFSPDMERRRVILATPIAETSITIENIGCVVDSGYFRRPVYDSSSGLSRLMTMRISRASAEQRTGRAGRLRPGSCYRLWDNVAEHNLLDQTPPEIVNADLVPLVLELALWGVSDPIQLSWLDIPRPSSWNRAVTLLTRLKLLDLKAHITELGRKVAALPIHPRLGFMLHASNRLKAGWTGCLLAGLLSEKDICHGRNSSADIYERMKILDAYIRNRKSNKRDVDQQLCHRIIQQADQWRKLLPSANRREIAFSELGNLLAFAFPDRVAQRRPGSRHRYTLANGRGAKLQPGDLLAGNDMLVIPNIDARQGDGKIFMAAPLTLVELQNHHAHLLNEVENVSWDKAKKRVHTSTDLMLDRLTISSKPLTLADSQKTLQLFLKGIQQSGSDCLPWNRNARDLQARICSLHFWQPDKWPNLSDEYLLQDLAWLAPYCLQMDRLSQLKEINLKTLFLASLPWEQQQRLEREAPTHIKVPSGSNVRITYTPGEPPTLAVRLQELFGLTETPTVCREQIPLTLHLLSPANRPMQITSDLASFWQNSYPEIKKELAGRYPKHYWPDNPLTATATSRTKKKMNLKPGQ